MRRDVNVFDDLSIWESSVKVVRFFVMFIKERLHFKSLQISLHITKPSSSVNVMKKDSFSLSLFLDENK